jgi:uncharacterized membrane protein YdjX (TVP38/TMEM64 family)
MAKEQTLRPVRIYIGLAVFVSLFLGAVAFITWWLLTSSTFFSEFDFSVASTTELIRSLGGWGVAASIGLMVLHSFVPFPAEILAIANAMVYGAFWGLVITWIGAMLGGYLAFGIARAFGRPLIKRIVPAKHWESIESWSRREGGIALLLSRFIPVIAFNLINYAAGLTHVSWWTFTWATGLGILPLTVLLSVAGERLSEPTLGYLGVWSIATVAVVATWIVLSRLRKKSAEGKRG